MNRLSVATLSKLTFPLFVLLPATADSLQGLALLAFPVEALLLEASSCCGKGFSGKLSSAPAEPERIILFVVQSELPHCLIQGEVHHLEGRHEHLTGVASRAASNSWLLLGGKRHPAKQETWAYQLHAST